MRWVIIYRDGDTFTSEDGPPAAAPGSGVQGIGAEDPVVGILPWYGEHYYVYNERLFGGWAGMNDAGLWVYIAQAREPLVIKLGEVIPTVEYLAFVAALTAHPLMPHKSARYPWEWKAVP